MVVWPIGWWICIKGELLGEVPGSSPWASSLWLIVLTITHSPLSLVIFSRLFVVDQIWQNTTNFGGLGVGANQPPFFYFWISSSWPSLGIFPLPHGSHDWATWQTTYWPTPSTCTIILPHHLPAMSTCHVLYRCHMSATSRTACHVAVWTATWHFLIGPHVDLKMSKMSDMWQPLVLPRHHVDMSA
jgi:hypothetical protein